MLISGLLLSVFPAAMFVSSALKLEPYYMFFVLLGSIVIFAPRDISATLSNRALAIGGILFGLGTLVKLWAFFPFVAAAICLVPRYRSRTLVFVGAAASSFVICALPFIVSAPGRFISQVVFDQLGKTGTAAYYSGTIWRLNDVMGLSVLSLNISLRETIAAGIALAAIVVFGFVQRPRYLVIDTYLIVAFAICTVSLLIAPQAFPYYGYFTAPFLIGILVISARRSRGPIGRWLLSLGASINSVHLVKKCLMVVVGIVLLAMSVSFERDYSHLALSGGMTNSYLSSITRLIPRGACVVYDQAFFGVYANRLPPSSPSCPDLVDPVGLWYAWGHGLAPPSPAFTAQWKSYFQAADYVVLQQPGSTIIPWDRSLTLWFSDNFHLVSSGPWIYVKTASP
jgi:hypothetical protein